MEIIANLQPTCGREPRVIGSRGIWAIIFAGVWATAWVTPLAAQNAGVVVISEINYHPAGGGQDLEYIELFNASTAPIDLEGWFFSNGVAFVFPQGAWLEPNAYLVVCANKAAVEAEYGVTNTVGDWAQCSSSEPGCALANGGEVIELSEPSGVVASRVRYNDRGRWPAAADGAGHSLELADVYSAQDVDANWAASGALGGSPGAPNTAATSGRPPVFLNEALILTEADRWVEIFNAGLVAVDLSGYFITDDRTDLTKARLPEGSVVDPQGYLVVQVASVGLALEPVVPIDGGPSRAFAALSMPAQDDSLARVVDARIFEPEMLEMSEARLPDGNVRWTELAVPTPGESNRVDVPDSIVINEILYNSIHRDIDGEYIELYNRGTAAVDISGWSFTRGFNFTFPEGTMMAPDSYLVVAQDPAYIRETYGLADGVVLGVDRTDEDAVDDFGRLRDDGEEVILRDAVGNIVDQLLYHDGGEWPLWADGGGSSLELIDANADNSVGAAWDASDDSAKSEATEFDYTGTYLTGQPELHVLLNHRGIAIMDDMRIFQRVVVFEPTQTFIDIGSEWKYFKGTQEPSEPRDAWRQPDFDDSTWLTGATPMGYGRGDEGTLLDDMRKVDAEGTPGYLSFFMRKEFNLDEVEGLDTFVFSVDFDDGFIAYLNGQQVAVGNMRDAEDGEGYQDTFDSRSRGSPREPQLDVNLSEFQDLLVPGRNVFALQVHNSSITNRDVWIAPLLGTGNFVNQDGENQVANGDFEEDITLGLRSGGWLIQGTHVRSGRTTVDPIAGSGSFKVVASAKGDNKVNRLEHTLPTLAPRSDYNVSLKARWVIGSPTFLTHGHNQASASFDYPKSHRLTIPKNLGTPGAVNSVTQRAVARNGDSNIGPVITDITQSAATPRGNEDVVITARISDPNGVGDVRLNFWFEDTRGQPGESATQSVAMVQRPDGVYEATIPGQAVRTRVIFFITAQDQTGRSGRYPVDPASRTHPMMLDPTDPEPYDLSYMIYRHDVPARVSNQEWQSYRFVIRTANEQQWSRQPLLSNDRLEGSFIFGDQKIYHNARVRFSGSPWARGGFGGSYRVYLPRDNPLHGSSTIKKFNMENHQRGDRSVLERLSHYLTRHNQGNIKVPYSFQWMVQWQLNDRVNGARECVQSPNRQFISYWFDDDDDGDLMEVDDRFEINDGGSRQASIDARWTYPPMRSGDGDSPENYRWFFNVRLNKGEDDYSTTIEGAKILDSRITPDAEFDEVVWDHIDVEQMLRVWAIRMNTDDWDTWGTDRGKNCYIFRPFGDGRWRLFAWDMELTYENVSRFMPGPITQPYNSINGGKFPEVVRMINRPQIKRMYYGILADFVDGPFNSQFLAPYLARQNRNGMTNTAVMRPSGWIDQRATRLRSVLRTATQVPLEITNIPDEGLAVETPNVLVEGRAPVQITRIGFVVNDRVPDTPVHVDFSNSDFFTWSAVVPLDPGENNIQAVGFNTAGDLLETDSAVVTSTPPVATLTSIDPEEAAPGDVVRLAGTNLHSQYGVFFGDTEAPAVLYDALPDSLLAEVPSNLEPGVVNVTLKAPDGATVGPLELRVTEGPEELFVRGDLDFSGTLSVIDAIGLLNYLVGDVSLGCLDSADVNDDGNIALDDALRLLNAIFDLGPLPPAPFPMPGVDPTDDDAFDCEAGR